MTGFTEVSIIGRLVKSIVSRLLIVSQTKQAGLNL